MDSRYSQGSLELLIFLPTSQGLGIIGVYYHTYTPLVNDSLFLKTVIYHSSLLCRKRYKFYFNTCKDVQEQNIEESKVVKEIPSEDLGEECSRGRVMILVYLSVSGKVYKRVQYDRRPKLSVWLEHNSTRHQRW